VNWQPGATVQIRGRKIDILEGGTTRPGAIGAGMLLRVELATTPEKIQGHEVIEIECGGRVLLVTLDLR
jgi:hypothetical protein